MFLPSQEIIRQVVHTCIGKANQYGFQTIAFPSLYQFSVNSRLIISNKRVYSARFLAPMFAKY